MNKDELLEKVVKEFNYKPLCSRCEHELIIDEDWIDYDVDFFNDNDDEPHLLHLICPNCGARITYYECDKEDRNHYGYWNDDNSPKPIGWAGYAPASCVRCGSACSWSNDFMLSDREGWDEEEYNKRAETEDALVSDTICPNCGGSHEIIDCSPINYDKYPFWRKQKEIWAEQEAAEASEAVAAEENNNV